MNSVHDMGGMQGMGSVLHEENEPVFHAPWEGRIYAINSSLRAMGVWNLDAWRHQFELLPPVDYLRMSYFERWLRINEQLLVMHGLVTAAEMATGTPDRGSAKTTPALTAAAAARFLGRDIPSSHDPQVPPHFKVCQLVRGPQHESDRTHTTPALYSRESGCHWARSPRLHVSGFQRAF